MSEARAPGRPRSETSREAILVAAFALLAERGYGAFAIEGVAARARVGKTTIYRWWPSKAALAIDAFLHATEAELRLPDTGSAERDFRAQITELAALLRGPRGRALAGMLAGAGTDPALGRALGERLLEPRRRWGVERMTRARDAGELRPGVVPAARALGAVRAALGPAAVRRRGAVGGGGGRLPRRRLRRRVRAVSARGPSSRTRPPGPGALAIGIRASSAGQTLAQPPSTSRSCAVT
jgi:AcrR family transcriptional regulator